MAQLNLSTTVVSGSPTITVDGDYSAQIQQHAIFLVGPSYVPYFVSANSTYSSLTGKTTIVLTGNWVGSSGVVAGVFASDFTFPDRIPTLRAGDVGTATLFTQAMLRVQSLFSLIASSGIEDVSAEAAAAIAAAAAASASATAAAASATAASGSATTAGGSATAAAASATAAAGSASSAATSASSAASTLASVAGEVADGLDDIDDARVAALAAVAGSVSAAAASATLAEQWASNPVNSVVASGKYSAYHWAQQAAASVVGVMVYRGLLDASGGSYPGSPASGDTYKISVAGTISGTAYLVGDLAHYNGSAWVRFGAELDTSDLLTKSGNLTGIVSPSAARTTLGLGDAAVADVDDFATAAQGTLAANAMPRAGGNFTGSVNFTGAQLRVRGDFSSTDVNRTMFQTALTDSGTIVGAIPFGTGDHAGWAAFADTDPDDAQFIELIANLDGPAVLRAGVNGAGAQQPLAMFAGATEVARLSAAGRLLVGQTTDDGSNKLQLTGNAKVTNTDAAGVILALLGNGATTPAKSFRVKDGILDILANDGTSSIFKLANDGSITVAGNIDAATKNVTKVANLSYDAELDNGNGSTAKTIDVAAKRWQLLTLSASLCSITLTAPTADGVWITNLRLAQDVTGNRAVSWPGTIIWAANGVPYIELAATRSTMVQIIAIRVSGVTTYFGSSIAH